VSGISLRNPDLHSHPDISAVLESEFGRHARSDTRERRGRGGVSARRRPRCSTLRVGFVHGVII